MLFDRDSKVAAMAQRELSQSFPQPGRVEHDPRRIWSDQLATAQRALAQAGVGARRRGDRHAMACDLQAVGGAPLAELRVDGGASVNPLLMQFQADLLGIPGVRPEVVETTALGAAWLAGIATGVYRSTDELSALWRAGRRFEPALSRERARETQSRWDHAVRQTVAT